MAVDESLVSMNFDERSNINLTRTNLLQLMRRAFITIYQIIEIIDRVNEVRSFSVFPTSPCPSTRLRRGEECCGPTIVRRIYITKETNGETISTPLKSSRNDTLWPGTRKSPSIQKESHTYPYIETCVKILCPYPYRVCVRRGKIAHNNGKKGHY